MLKQSDVTIIIPHLGANKDQCYAFHECYDSLKDSFTGKIIVVKNGKSEYLCTCHRDIELLTEQGQCKAVNSAIATTSTPWVLVTNDDMIFPPGWYEKLVIPFEQSFLIKSNLDLKEEDLIVRPHGFIPVQDIDAIMNIDPILCISPKLIEPRPGAPTFEVYPCGGAGGDFDKQKFFEFAKTYSNRVQTEPIIRTGFNLPFLIKTEVFRLVEGYDNAYDPWGSNSDSDLEYKLKLAGIQPWQNTASIVYHFSQTSGTFEPKNSSFWGRNFAYFKEKWGFDRTDNGIWEANFTIPPKDEGRIYSPWWENFYL